MENIINEAYIANLSKYIHLLSNDEVIKEIIKINKHFNGKKIPGYDRKKEKILLEKTIDTLNKRITS